MTEAKYKIIPLLDFDLHTIPVRLAARLFDPEAFVICSAILKTHNAVVATLSVKNMTLGAPLHNAPKETPRWNDKRKYHERRAPDPLQHAPDGAGHGPVLGRHRDRRVRGHGRQRSLVGNTRALADRHRLNRLHRCRPRGGGSAWASIPRGSATCASAASSASASTTSRRSISAASRSRRSSKKYQLHKDIERELQWMGPIQDLPPKLG